MESAHRKVTRYTDPINRLGSAIGVLLFALMVITVIFQVMNRWIPFDATFIWTESLSRYLLIIVTFYGTAIASRDNEHVKISFLLKRPPQQIARALAILGYLGILIFNAVVLIGAVASYNYNKLPGTGRQFHVLPQVAPFTRDWISLVIIFSFILVSLFVLRDVKILLTDAESIDKLFGNV